MSVILGLNFFHMDTSACLVADGVLKSVIAQERLGRRLKHDPSFPADSIRHVLAESGVRLANVTHVAVAGDPRSNYRAKVGYVLRRPWHSAGAVVEHFRRRRRSDDLVRRLAEICECDPSEARFEVVRVEHHLAHIASAYYLSPFDGLTAGFSFDASGDFVSAMAARCEGTKIEILDRVYLPDSLGFFLHLDRLMAGEEAAESASRQPVLLVHTTRRVRYGDLKNRLCHIHRYLCSVHRAPPPLVAFGAVYC